MTKIICRTESSNENYNANCNYMVINLTPALLQKISNTMRLVRNLKSVDNNVFDIRTFTYEVECYAGFSGLPHEEDIDAALDFNAERWAVMNPADEPLLLDMEEERAECFLMAVDECSCQFSCNPRHDNTEISSPIAYVKDLEKWAKLLVGENEQGVSHAI